MRSVGKAKRAHASIGHSGRDIRGRGAKCAFAHPTLPHIFDDPRLFEVETDSAVARSLLPGEPE
jgi:hypothetical protein